MVSPIPAPVRSAENEGLWLRDGGPTDEQWNAYKNILVESCGIEKLTEVYQAAYDRYVSVQSQKEAN